MCPLEGFRTFSGRQPGSISLTHTHLPDAEPCSLGWALGNALKEGGLFLTPPGKNPRFLLGKWGWGGVRERERTRDQHLGYEGSDCLLGPKKPYRELLIKQP